MFRYLKLFIFSIILLILLIPAWMSSLALYDYKFNSWPPDFFKDYEHLIEGDYDPDDEIRIIKQYCLDNDNFGRKLNDCIDSELHVMGVYAVSLEASPYMISIFGGIFILYLLFYIWWLRRNFFKNV